jgi:hypothetical protein
MSTPITPAGGSTSTPKSSTSAFDAKLDIARSSKIVADYMRQTGKSAITLQELAKVADNASGKVPAEVSDAAKYLARHPDVDNLSGVWNFDWAANGGLKGTATEAIAKMQDTFDLAIAKSAQITEITTGKKAELDSTKQRPSN